MVEKLMMNTMTALVAILAYGLAVGAVGIALAFRERTRRKVRGDAKKFGPPALAQSLHGRLRTDAGEEMEVYLQKAGQ
jgi:hypothetical protein